MTIAQLHAKAVAYEASRDEIHYWDLQQADLQTFWQFVNALRNVRDYKRFWADQHGRRESLP